MTIRFRIVTLLALLCLLFFGSYLLLNHVQKKEEAFTRKQLEFERTSRLKELVNTKSRPGYRYLRDNSASSGLVEFLARADPGWADKHLKSRLDTYRLDCLWVLHPDGTVIYDPRGPAEAAHNVLPLSAEEWRPILAKNAHFSFYTFLPDGLYQVQGMPIRLPSDLDRKAAPEGWLVVAKRWGEPLLEDLANALQGQLTLTPPGHVSDVTAPGMLEVWLPLPDHHGRTLAGLDYHYQDSIDEDPTLEKLEGTLFILNGLGALLLVGALLQHWVLRPAYLVRTSLVNRDSALLTPLLAQPDEFGQIARAIQSSIQDRAQLEKNLEERVRLGRDLHDGAVQGIYGAGMALSQVQALLGRNPPAAQQLIEETRTELNRIIKELRGHIEQADPRLPDHTFAESTARLIHLLCGSGPITTELNIDEALVATHGPLLRNQALQFVREAISNAVRHGRPSHLAVSWQRRTTGSLLMIADDGHGFDPEVLKPGGRGLGNLTERALALGGRLEVVSQPNQGTRLSLILSQPKSSP